MYDRATLIQGASILVASLPLFFFLLPAETRSWLITRIVPPQRPTEEEGSTDLSRSSKAARSRDSSTREDKPQRLSSDASIPTPPALARPSTTPQISTSAPEDQHADSPSTPKASARRSPSSSSEVFPTITSPTMSSNPSSRLCTTSTTPGTSPLKPSPSSATTATTPPTPTDRPTINLSPNQTPSSTNTSRPSRSPLSPSAPITAITNTTTTTSNLMPPPPRPTPRIPSNRNSTLHAPPNRTPVSASLAPTTSTLPAPSRPRQKVILKPGHSPLDWAHLTTSTPSYILSGVPSPQRVTRAQLGYMNGRKGRPAWAAFKGKVYNIGPYMDFHPGGVGELRRGAGKVADGLFEEVHPWVSVEGMLGGCLVGVLVEGEGEGEELEGLD